MAKQLFFKVGDRVSYVLADSVLFSGVIIEAELSKSLKPYTIKADDGSVKYANESFLKPAIKP